MFIQEFDWKKAVAQKTKLANPNVFKGMALAPSPQALKAGPIKPAATLPESSVQVTANALANEERPQPRLLLMGLKRSGKTSISNVVFRKMRPDDTINIGTTSSILKESMQTFMDIQIWDLPGQITFYNDPNFDTDAVFGGVGALVWILDASDDYMQAIGPLTETMLALQEPYPHIRYNVFVHKTDALSDDVRDDIIADIVQRITDELYDVGIENPAISYYGTSIYDHTILEGFSRVMQGLVPQLPTFESMLDSLKSNCLFEKVYLFDIVSKIYIASDTDPIDGRAYEVCADYIDFIVDLSEIYGWPRPKDGKKAEKTKEVRFAEAYVIGFKGWHLHLREVSAHLALIGISKDPDFQAHQAVRDQNLQIFQDYLIKVLEPTNHEEQEAEQ